MERADSRAPLMPSGSWSSMMILRQMPLRNRFCLQNAVSGGGGYGERTVRIDDGLALLLGEDAVGHNALLEPGCK